MKRNDVQREHRRRFESLVLAYDSALSDNNFVATSSDDALPKSVQTQLRAAQATLRMLEKARLDGITSSGSEFGTPYLEVFDDTQLELPDINGQQIGHFNIERELGRGGFGVVFLARDHHVGRLVALKVPRPEVLISRSARLRFLREAKAAGALTHPNLVGVYEVGQDGPLCYIASEFCDGPNLAHWLASTARPPTSRDAAVLVEVIARAVEHAHHRGVLHRDIKPSNILLAPTGQGAGQCLTDFIPRLTDFGLAKLVELADDATRTGALLGTPAYMAPEQAEGRIKEIGAATDVYALGLVLYELLAGHPPFRGASDVQTLQLVARGDVPRLPARHPAIARDLEAIVFKCLERETGRRYASAGALANDLRRFLNGEPTLVRPANAAKRLFKWAHRRPAVAALAVVSTVAAVVVSGGGWWYSANLSRALARVEAAEQEHRQTLYVADVDRARHSINLGQDQLARELLDRWIPQSGEADLREFSWHYAWRQLHDEMATLIGHKGDVYCVRYSPDGRLLATSSQDRTARLWDPVSGACLQVLAGHGGDVNCVAFSPDGLLVATVDDQGSARIWQVVTGKLLHEMPAHQGQAFGVAFSPKGEWLATCGEDKLAILWNTKDWKKEAVLAGHGKLVGSLSFSSDGKMLATASDDETVILWDLATRESIRRLSHSSQVGSVEFDHSGTSFLAAARNGRQACLWQAIDTLRGKTAPSLKVVHAIGFDHTDARFAVGTKDGAVQLYDSATLNSLHRFRGHSDRVWSLNFSPDRSHLATASADRTIKLWQLPTLTGSKRSKSIGQVRALSFSGSRGLYASGDGRGNLEIINLATQQVLRTIAQERQVVGDFDGDGKLDPGTYQDGVWRLQLSSEAATDSTSAATQIRHLGTSEDVPVVGDWDADGCDNLGIFRPSGCWFLEREGVIQASQFGPNRVSQLPYRFVPLVGHWTGKSDRYGLAVFDLPSNRWIYWLNCGAAVARLNTESREKEAIPICGRWPTLGNDAAGRDGDAIGLYGSEGLWAEPFHGRSLSRAVARAKKEKSVIWSDPRNPIFVPTERSEFDTHLLDAANDRARNDGYGTVVQTLAFSNEGDRVAMCLTDDYRVKVWEVDSGRKLGQLRQESSTVIQVAYSPVGLTLAVGTQAGDINFYDADDLRFKGTLHSHEELQRFAYSADGRLLVTVGDGGQVKVWDQQQRLIQRLTHDEEKVLDVAVSQDSRWLVTVGSGGLVNLWNLTTSEQLAAMPGHETVIEAVAISPDGRTIASGDASGIIKLWDLATRQELYTLATLGSMVRVLMFSPDGQDLFAGTIQNASRQSLHVWSLRPANNQLQPGKPSAGAANLTRLQD